MPGIRGSPPGPRHRIQGSNGFHTCHGLAVLRSGLRRHPPAQEINQKGGTSFDGTSFDGLLRHPPAQEINQKGGTSFDGTSFYGPRDQPEG
ncbi:MAG: hypothetical protein MI919_42045, partial [Holophagales bacterium]|nr:hypothetical protein [Holophagales bacterium]